MSNQILEISQHEVLTISWAVAQRLFTDGDLSAPVVLLVDDVEMELSICLEKNTPAQEFRKRVLKAASQHSLVAAVYICVVNVVTENLPVPKMPPPSFDALLLVVAGVDGARIAQSSTIHYSDVGVSLGLPVDAEIPGALLVDEIVAMKSTLH